MTKPWPDSQAYWRDKRVIVTGGAGFLGSYMEEKLQEHRAAEIMVSRRKAYDLRDLDATRHLLDDTSRREAVEVIIHLAAHVGGIGANRRSPVKFFYDNLMSVPLMRESSAITVGTSALYL